MRRHLAINLYELSQKGRNPYSRCKKMVQTPRDIRAISGSISEKRSPRDSGRAQMVRGARPVLDGSITV